MPTPAHTAREYFFEGSEHMARELAASVAAMLAAAIRDRGRALIAVSGGSSPKKMFAHLSQAAIPWSAVTITQVDERWVPVDNADSNARLIRENLLVNAAAAATFVSLKNSAATPEAG